jgi:hypothetical protein
MNRKITIENATRFGAFLPWLSKTLVSPKLALETNA